MTCIKCKIIVGSKSSELRKKLIRTFTEPYEDDNNPCDVYFYEEEIDGDVVTLQFWDIKDVSIPDLNKCIVYGAKIVILIFDADNSESLSDLKDYIKAIENSMETQFELILMAGNITENRQLDKEQGMSTASKHNAEYFEFDDNKEDEVRKYLIDLALKQRERSTVVTTMPNENCNLRNRRFKPAEDDVD